MALARSLFWFSPAISSQPGAAAAIGRIKVQFLPKRTYKLRPSVINAVPWSPRRCISRGFRGEPLRVASIRVNDVQSQVEGSPREWPDGNEDREALIPEAEITTPRRRRRAKRKGEDLRQEAVDEAAPVERLKSIGVVTTLESNSQELLVEGSSLELAVVGRENADAQTGQKSSSFSSFIEVPEAQAGDKAFNAADDRGFTSNSGTEQLEQASGGTEKKKNTKTFRKSEARLKSVGVVTTIQSNSSKLVVEESFSEPGVVPRDHVDAITGEKSSLSFTFTEFSEAEVVDKGASGANGREVTSIPGTKQLEQVEVEIGKKKKKARKPKERLKPIRVATILASNTSKLVVEESSLEPGAVTRDYAIVTTGQNSSSSISFTELPKTQVVDIGFTGANGREVTSISGQREQALVEAKKHKKKKSRKPKEGGAVSNGTVSAITGNDTGGVEVGRKVAPGESSNERGPPKITPDEVGINPEEFFAWKTIPITSLSSESSHCKEEETSSQVITKGKSRSKKKLVVDPEQRHASEDQEVDNNTRSGAAVLVTDDSGNTGNSRIEGEEHLRPPIGQRSSKARKRRERRKAKGLEDPSDGSGEQLGNDNIGGFSDVDLETHSIQETFMAVDRGIDDGLPKGDFSKVLFDSIGLKTSSNLQPGRDDATKRAESEGSPDTGASQKISQSNSQNGSASESRSGYGAVTAYSIDVQNQIARTESEVGEDIASDSVDPAKPAKKGRRRKRKKKPSSSVQIESQAEVIIPSADDLFESIVWCTVHLKVQAELEENQRLYVVGANPELGGWDLSQALPLLETDEGVWGNTLKIPRGTMLEYKYFSESQDAGSAVLERWFGPEIQHFLAWQEGPGSEVELIRDLWIPDVPAKLPLLSWGDRWWEEMDSMRNDQDLGDLEGYDVSITDLDLRTRKGKELDGREQQSDSEQTYYSEDRLDVSEKKAEIPIEEPVVEEWLKKKIRKKVFPREEPWLLESMILDQNNGAARKKIEECLDGPDGGAESLVAEKKDPEVRVEILINSPQCTMQRMAIVEDGKLVELLVEPVNTRVQVGNIYLGVVRQLLPGMTGVFVDIGDFQLSLLAITRNEYPYTFPSIGQAMDVPSDGLSLVPLDDHEDSAWEDSETEDEDDDEDESEEDDHENDCHEDEEVDDWQLDQEVKDDTFRRSARSKGRVRDTMVEDHRTRADPKRRNLQSLVKPDSGSPVGPITVNFGRKLKKWRKLQEGMQIIVQVKKEALGKKGPRLTAFPNLAGRFWVLTPGGKAIGVSRRITGPERKRLRQLAEDLLPLNFSLTVRTEALGQGKEELEKDLARLMETWKEVLGRASAAAVAAEQMDGPMPVLLHRAMGQFLTIVRDFFNDKAHRMVIDSPQCYQEVTSYLQEIAPHLTDRVELYTDKTPIFDAFDIEPELEKFSKRRVSLPNGGYLVMEETEALVSIDVNGGMGVLSHDISQEEAILAINLAAARQIATELRLRDIGGIIVVDFIDMEDPRSEKMVVEEMQKAIARDRSNPSLSEISEFGLMEMTRKRVRPSVTLTISDPCSHCGGVGRVEAYETTLSKIERAILRLMATRPGDTYSSESTKWPHFILRVDNDMGEYLKGRKRKRMTQLSAALKVWLTLKVAVEFTTSQFQVLEQHRLASEKRPNGAGQTKSSQANIGPDLLGKRGVWPGKRRRNFANQGSTK